MLIADSAGSGLLGELYATPERPELVAALRGIPESRIGRSETLNEEILATAAPIFVSGTPRGAVRISQPTSELRAALTRTIAGVVAIGIGGLLAGLVLALILAGSLSRPLRRLAAATARLGAGDLSVRAGETRGSREIEEVARSFDDMAARLENLVRAQREFVGNASHQLRTPLTGLKLRLEAAAAKTRGAGKKDIEAAEREADRLAMIVERLLTTARRVESGVPAFVDLAEAATHAADRWSERASADSSHVSVRAERAWALIDRADLDQILDNLIDNAIRYAPGPIEVGSGAVDGTPFVRVTDRGSGIVESERARITERFYRGAGAPPGGSGLGLAVVRELAERWNGVLSIADGPDGGTRVEITFPASDDDLAGP